MEFNKTNFNDFKKALSEATKNVEKQFGVEIEFGECKYDENSFTIKTEVFKESKNKMFEENFIIHCEEYGFKKEDLGKTFTQGADKIIYTILGLNLSNQEFPIVCIDENGENSSFIKDIKRIL